jgi:dTDP-glucose 4,6-dehydratase
MKTLVTGAGGFVGSHLIEKCIEAGHKVTAFVRYNSKNSWGWLDCSKYKNDIQVISGDIRDFDSVHAAMEGIENVFHLAALIGIPYSYVSPLAYIKTNIEGTYNVLESARRRGTPNVLVTSTSETYGTAQTVPMDENHPMVGQSPYSASKIGSDNLSVSYSRSFGLPVKIVRPFNIYGPRQSARAIIPSVIIQILNGRKQLKLGNTVPTRDFTFVTDTANAFLEIAKAPQLNGQFVNVGMKHEISILNLVRLIARMMDTEIEVHSDELRVRPAGSEVERLFSENAKILFQTRWKPEYDLERGLKETIQWLRENRGEYKADIYNV